MSRSAPAEGDGDGVAAPSVGDGVGLGVAAAPNEVVPSAVCAGLSARERIVQASLCLTVGGPVRPGSSRRQHHARLRKVTAWLSCTAGPKRAHWTVPHRRPSAWRARASWKSHRR